MPHLVLLGDSVFDNAAYVQGGPDVVAHLRGLLGSRGRATLLARDGSVSADVERQLERLPEDATHLVVSAGGNDALRVSSILEEGARSVAQVLMRIADAQEAFASAYGRMARAVLARGLPTAFCTIYDPRYPDPLRRRVATTALSTFNDPISRTAFAAGASLIDLRLVCGEDADFANPIEPSVAGGAKIARAIAAFGAAPAGPNGASRVIARV